MGCTGSRATPSTSSSSSSQVFPATVAMATPAAPQAAAAAPPPAAVDGAASPPDDAMSVVARTATGGVGAVVALMGEKCDDPEFQCWCCDAMAGLCAGNEAARSQVKDGGGLGLVLDAMVRFSWETPVQIKGNWLLAIMASSWAAELGAQGAVELVLAGMRACEDDYQVQTSGIRCLQNLIAGSQENRARAKAAGAAALLRGSLERSPEDGQLQYRGKALLERLDSVAPAVVAAVAENDRVLRTGASAARLVASPPQTQRPGSAPTAAGGTAMPVAAAAHATSSSPLHTARASSRGSSGASLAGAAARVAAAARQGIVPVVEYFRAHGGTDVETARWCCDAIFTTIAGAPGARAAAHDAGALPLIVEAMGSGAGAWDEELQLKAVWALLALAPAYTVEIGGAGGVEALVASMSRNATAHDLQVSAVKLLSLLTLEPSGANLRRARLANAIAVVKAVIRGHTEDGTLTYRGVNLLERLEPGCTASIPKLNMVRTASMAAEEMVLSARTTGAHTARTVPGGPSRDADVAAANAAAIAEVDELAEMVEEGESDGEGPAPLHHTAVVAVDGTAVAAAMRTTPSRPRLGVPLLPLPGAVESTSAPASGNVSAAVSFKGPPTDGTPNAT